MTYTVKNGTWCKDNEKEYYSTTKTGLKAALKAGEISAGTRVVVHDRRYEPGQLIDSLNPNPPEGFFRPDGSDFDETVYQELYKVLGTNKLPDLRECTLVMVGESERTDIANHDVYTAGEFKDDQIQSHVHSRGTMEITGMIVSDNNGSRSTGGAFYNAGYAGGQSASGSGGGQYLAFKASRTWEGKTSLPETMSDSYEPTVPVSNPATEGLYELKVTYKPSTDTVYNTSKTYYDAGNKVTDPFIGINPSALGWYEKLDDDVYEFTTDTTVDTSKNYYAADGDVEPLDVYSFVNPSEKGWEEIDTETYELTADTTVISGKTYYKKITAESDTRVGVTTHGKQFGVYRYIAF